MLKKNSRLVALFIMLLLSILFIMLPSLSNKNSSHVTIDRLIDLPLINQHEQPAMLVFFGYSGCMEICTPRLMQIAAWYETLNELKKQTTLLFFDLSPSDNTQQADAFAKSFHPDFHGIQPGKPLINDYVSAFDVYYAPSLFKSNEIDHTPHLYLLKKIQDKYHLRIIYFSYPYDMIQIKADLETLLNE